MHPETQGLPGEQTLFNIYFNLLNKNCLNLFRCPGNLFKNACTYSNRLLVCMTNQQQVLMYKGCIKGNRQAQRQLFDSYKKAVFALCLRYASDKVQAQDLMQEGFIKIFKDLGSYDASKGALWTWMRRVIINACLQYIRRNRKFDQEFLVGEDIDIVEDPQVKASPYSAKELMGYLQKLPHGYRTVFNLHVMEGYTHPEIAEILDISINTSKSQLSKAKAFLRRCLLEGKLKSRPPKLEVTR